MNRIRTILLTGLLLLLLLPLSAIPASNSWSGSTPFATGLGNRIINALALTPDGQTVYAGSGSGTVLSYDIVPPSVTTVAASGTSAVATTLNGSVNAQGGSFTTLFRYGTSSGVYGSSLAATPSPVTGSTDTAISASLTGLVPNTSYYFLAEATGGSTLQGSELSFSTAKLAPGASTNTASYTTIANVTLNGTVNAQNDSTTVSFEYGTSTSYGSTVAASSSPMTAYASTSVSAVLTSLLPNVTYHFRVKAINSTGTTYGADQNFIDYMAPTISTGAVTLLAATSATLNGTVMANNSATTVTFNYGLTSGLGSTALASQNPVIGMASTGVSAAIGGLTANTLYYYQASAVSNGDTQYGSILTFTTALAAPVASAASAVSGTGFTANWGAVTGATKYFLDVATDSSFVSLVSGYNNRDVGNVTNLAVTGLSANTAYWYRVRANNANSTSADSNAINQSTGSSKVVTNNNDSGAGSLRQTLIDANPGDTITFAASVTGSITLTSGVLPVSKDVTISGPGAAVLTVSGGGAWQIFNVTGVTRFSLQNLKLANGVAVGGGALVDNSASTTTITGCVFSGNSSSGPAANGGAIIVEGSMTISDSVFSGNSAAAGYGGAIFNGGGVSVTIITNTLFSGNSADSGGALANLNFMALENVTVNGNSATTWGGAIVALSGLNLRLVNTTLAGNTAAQGGGIYAIAGAKTDLKNSIIAGNTAAGGGHDIHGAVIELGYSLIGSTTGATIGGTTTHDIAGTDASPVDPKLGALADNGGTTQTLALLFNSPAIDAGTCSGAPAADQRGMARPQNTLCDIGAYERGVPASVTATGGTPQSTQINTAFATALTAKVADSLGRGLDGVSVAFAGPGSGASIAAGGSVNTDGTGIASFSASANGAGGAYAVTATVNALTASFSLSNSLGTQAALSLTSTIGSFGTPLSLTASGGTGTGAFSYAVNSAGTAGCSISGGSTLNATTAGSCTVTATKAADSNYNAASSAATTVSFGLGTQAAVTLTSTSGSFGTPLTLTAGGGTGTGAFSYAVSSAGTAGCSISGGTTLNATTPGSCTVTATKAADSNYNAASSPATTVSFGLATQAAVTLTSTSGSFGTPLSLTASGGTGTGAFSYAVSTAGTAGCSISGGTILNATTPGTCTVTATRGADSNYNAASSSATTVSFGLGTQAAVTLTSTSGSFGTPLTLTASGGTGTGAFSYAVSSAGTAGCSISGGGTLNATTAGSCTVTATKAADSNYNAASSPATTVSFGLATQATLTLTSTSGSFGTPLTLTASGGTGTGAFSYAVNSAGTAGCSISGGTTLNATTPGSCTVTATKAADSNYSSVSSPATTVSFGMATQAALTLTSTNGSFGTPLTLSASGGSGTGAISYAVTATGTAGCSITGGTTLNATATGSCTVTANRAADSNYNAASSSATTVSFGLATQTALTLTSTSGTFGTPLSLTSSGGTGTGALSYAVNSAGTAGCSVSGGSTLNATTAGSCTVTATKAADSNYSSVSSPATTVSFGLVTQAALSLTSTSGSFGTPLALLTSGGSGTGALSYSVSDGTALACVITTGALSVSSAGTCLVTANKAADSNYNAATTGAVTVTMAKANQAALTLTSTSSPFGTPLTLTASGGSGSGALSYSASNGTALACVITSGALSVSSAGTCTVTVTRAADVNYNAASSTATTVSFGAATQAALTLTSTSGTFGTPLTLTASGGSGSGALSYSVSDGTALACVITSGALSASSAGTCLVTASKAADGNYNAATTGAVTVTIAKANQAALTLTSISGTFGTPLTLTASGGSGSGALSYSASDGTALACVITSGALSASSAGTCLVTASKAADGNYNAATTGAVTVTVSKASQGALTATATPASIVFNASSALGVTGGSGTGTVSYAVTAGATFCSISGSTLSGIGVGSCTVTATQAADANYSAATATATVTVGKATPVISWATPAPIVFGTPLSGSQLNASAGGVAGSFVYTPPSGTLLNTGPGQTLSASFTPAATSSYNSPAPATVLIAVSQTSQSALTAIATPTSIAYNATSALSSSGGSGSGSLSFAVTAGASFCAITGSTLTGTGVGTCTVTASKAADANYSAATATVNVSVGSASQTITFGAAPLLAPGGSATVSATGGGSGNPVTFASGTPLVCRVTGNSVTALTAGTCNVVADQLGNANYSAAAQASQSVNVGVVTSYTGLSATGSGNITASFTGGGAGCGFSANQFVPVSSAATPPPTGIAFPHGLFDFTTSGCTPGSTLAFSISYPLTLPSDTQYWKFGPTPGNATPHWYALPASITGNSARFNITDGGLGDDDLTVNGSIVDQGGSGAPAATSVTGIPTLSEWGVIILSGLLALLGLAQMRRLRVRLPKKG